jgi:23S rRNA pseudouridine2605 synthase
MRCLSEEQMRKLVEGIELADGIAKCEKVEDGGGEEEGANHWYHVVLKEGRNREVRRLFEALNVPVSRLIRTRYGTLAMPSTLKRGDTMELEAPEVNAVLEASGIKPGNNGARPQGQQRPQGKQRGGQRPQRPQGQGGGQRPHGKGQRQGARPPREGQPRPDFETTQPASNANAIGLRPHHGPQRRGGFGGGQPRHNAPRPQQQRGPRVDFDEMQPTSNANASPFGHTLTLPHKTAHGNGEGFNTRGNRSGPRGRPGQGGAPRGKGGPQIRHRKNAPRVEADGNVAPVTSVPRDDEA